MSGMTTTLLEPYTAKKWQLAGLKGISDRTLETHFGLYEGYVKNTNLLNEERDELMRAFAPMPEQRRTPADPGPDRQQDLFTSLP